MAIEKLRRASCAARFFQGATFIAEGAERPFWKMMSVRNGSSAAVQMNGHQHVPGTHLQPVNGLPRSTAFGLHPGYTAC